jgi:hypothetical protein
MFTPIRPDTPAVTDYLRQTEDLRSKQTISFRYSLRVLHISEWVCNVLTSIVDLYIFFMANFYVFNIRAVLLSVKYFYTLQPISDIYLCIFNAYLSTVL